jgi:hypothetical protein
MSPRRRQPFRLRVGRLAAILADGIYERVGFSSEEAVLLSHNWEAFF